MFPKLDAERAARSRFADGAARIGHRLCRDAIWAGDRCNWMAKPRNELVYESLGSGLDAGTSGVALFLARLHTIQPAPLLRATAEGTLRQSYRSCERIAPNVRGSLNSGVTGIVHASFDVAHFLQDDCWAREACTLLDTVDLAYDPARTRLGDGVSGIILVLLRAVERMRHDRYLEEAVRLGGELVRSVRTAMTSGAAAVPGYVNGCDGIAHALLELDRLSGERAFREAALELMRWERDRLRSIADLSWSDGHAGAGIVRLKALATGADADVAEDLAVSISRVTSALCSAATPGPQDFSLSSGLAGMAELLLGAAVAFGDERLRRCVEHQALTAMTFFHDYGYPWPCSIHTGGETPGLLDGVAGIGVFYLRLYDCVTFKPVFEVP